MAIERGLSTLSCQIVALNDDGIFKKPSMPALNVKKKLKVLDEDTYTQDLENIIEHDFFPDLPKLRAQNDYLKALEENDVVKLREIRSKYASKLGSRLGTSFSACNSPVTFETPLRKTPSSQSGENDSTREKTMLGETALENRDKLKAKERSLDSYLAQNTSEDNASFGNILEEAKKQHREKCPWLYEREEKFQRNKTDILALPSIERQALEYNRPLELDTWDYKSNNSLMYVPEGIQPTEAEAAELQRKQREIVHMNTGFEKSPFNELANRQAISEAAQIQARMKEGKIGIDGKELLPSDSPQVNGYGFVVTPSPAPGVDASPIMTWGEIEGTPFLLDGGSTPQNHAAGPTFRIADTPARDKLAHELADKARQRNRLKKQDALRAMHENLVSPSNRQRSFSTTDRLETMSPAAQRLASSHLGIRMGTDKALLASYTPRRSSVLSTSALSTPNSTPTPTTSRRHRSSMVSPRTVDKALRHVADDAMSLTDNLLQIPKKRSKASDFFTA